MLSTTARSSARLSSRQINSLSRRGFQSTALRSGGYHYPEGPRSSLPFDPLKKGFAFKYWGFMFVGFSLPFWVASKSQYPCLWSLWDGIKWVGADANDLVSLVWQTYKNK